MKAQVIFGSAFAIVGVRFALAAGGVLELDWIDYAFIAFLMFIGAHGAFTADLSDDD